MRSAGEISASQETSVRSTKVVRRVSPGPYWGIVVVASCFCINLINDGFLYSNSLFFVEFLQEFQTNKFQTSWITSICQGMAMIPGPLYSYLVIRFTPRLSTMFGFLLAGTAVVISGEAHNLYVLYITMGIMVGVARGLIATSYVVTLYAYFQERRATAFGVAMSGAGIGGLVVVQLVHHVMDRYHWRLSARVLGAILYLGMGAAMSFRPIVFREEVVPVTTKCGKCNTNYEKDEKEKSDQTSAQEALPVEDRKQRAVKLAHRPDLWSRVSYRLGLYLFKNPYFGLITAAQSLLFFSFSIPILFSSARAAKLGISRHDDSWLLPAMGIGNSVSRVLTGVVSDRLPRARGYLFATALTVMGIWNLVSVAFTDYAGLMAFSLIHGILLGTVISLLFVIVADVLAPYQLHITHGDQKEETTSLATPDNLAKAIGLASLFRGVAVLLGAPLGGLLYDCTHKMMAPFLLEGSMLLISGVLAFLIPIRNPLPQSAY